jgi:ABC-2 type transport system permease protein
VSHVLAIAGRELRSLLSTPVAYVLFAVYMVFAGYIFFLSLEFFLVQIQQVQMARLPPEQLVEIMSQFNLNDRVIGPSMGTFSFVFVLLVPLLTMRAFAEERANGTIELLLTSPLTAWEIVLGKYLGVLGLVGILVGLTALYPMLLMAYGDPELLQTAGGLLGLFLYGAALAALGCFVSSLTRSQTLAATVSVVAGLMLLLIDVVAEVAGTGGAAELLRYLGIRAHFEQSLQGVITTPDLTYFAVMIVFFLTLTRTSVESLRWR